MTVPRTFEAHRANLMQKLGLHALADLIVLASGPKVL